jgi:alpha-L-fucosidase
MNCWKQCLEPESNKTNYRRNQEKKGSTTIMNLKDEQLVKVVPSHRQLLNQSLEFYSFVHFTVNTFTGREWGEGTEEPQIFNPIKMDANQWVKAVKSAGMKGLILTCKHHDGFCLWPSKYTDHTIAKSPYKDGNGDIVREVVEACKKEGIQFGVYLSPWDRNNQLYGQGKPYDDYFINQLTELLTGYGDVFSVWFDGACGEGPNGKKQYYDWDRYYSVIRSLQPNACINVCGPDVRWCGNEAGDTRESEWSVVPERTKDTEKIASKSQSQDDEDFRQREIFAGDRDLGSREVLANEDKLIWYPAEVNTSIRPGWFYHEEEDDKVKSVEELIKVYNNSVGGNATFLLNIPPTKEGLFHQEDVKRLQEIGDYLRTSYETNLMDKAVLHVDSIQGGHDIDSVRTDDYQTYFKTEDGTTECTIDINWDKEVTVKHIVLKENILLSQRIEAFIVEAEQDGEFVPVYKGTIVGYKKIIALEIKPTSKIRIRILDSRVSPTLSFVGIY